MSGAGLLWKLRKAGPNAPVSEESDAEKLALYIVATTFFLLAICITYESHGARRHEEPLTSPVGIALAVISLAVMPALAFAKQRVGKQMGSSALVADAKNLFARTYRLHCLSALALSRYSAGGGPTRSERLRCCP